MIATPGRRTEVRGEEKARELLAEAGLTSVETVDADPFNLYYVCRRS
jgi:hypothetical protein